MTRLPPYAVECPYCAQVIHVADGVDAHAAITLHLLDSPPLPARCAYWPDHAYRRLRARRTRRARRRRWDLEDVERDLGYCAYYLRCMGVPGFERGICSGGAGCTSPSVMEPLCVTCEPLDGWPSTRYIKLGELGYQPATIGGTTP